MLRLGGEEANQSSRRQESATVNNTVETGDIAFEAKGLLQIIQSNNENEFEERPYLLQDGVKIVL